jgi:membrane-associated protein
MLPTQRWLRITLKILSIFFVLWIISFFFSDDVQHQVFLWTQRFGYYVIFPWIVLANIVVGLPSSFLPIGIGVAASQGGYDPLSAITVITVASVLGDVIAYALARRFRWIFLKALGIKDDDPGMQQAMAYVQNGGGRRMVFITRFLFGAILGFVNYAAGMLRMRFWSFLWLAILGELIWSIIWFGLGYYPFEVGKLVRTNWPLALLLIALLLIPLVIAHLRYRKRGKNLGHALWDLLIGKMPS